MLCSVSVRAQAGARAGLGNGVREGQRLAMSEPRGAESVGVALLVVRLSDQTMSE